MPIISFDSFASVHAPITSATAPSSPALSRSSSVASNVSQASHQSAPTWSNNSTLAAGNRSASVADAPGHPAPSSRGLKHFFSAEGKAERKERKRKEQERIDKVVLTSRHAATVKTRMLMEQHNRQSKTARTAEVVGTTQSAHLTAAQQEARLPHSGPPSLHSAHKAQERDMPMLTRIVSCDERDEEEERLNQHRDDWILRKADVATMHRVREGSGSDTSEEEMIQVLHGRAVESDSDGSNRAGLQGDVHPAKPVKSRRGFGTWSRNEAGIWTR